MSTERWYLAGPMFGIPQCNIPAFDSAAAKLRAVGLDIVSPAELDDPIIRAACLASVDGKYRKTLTDQGTTLGDILARDIRVVIEEVRGVVLMPGWTKSRGARLEVMAALLYDKEFLELIDGKVRAVMRAYIRADLARNIP